MGSFESAKEEPGVLLRRRLQSNKLSQADAARIFGKSRAWASQELFADPRKTLRRMLIDQPATLDTFAKALGWSGRDELLVDMDVFEGTPLAGDAPITLDPKPTQPARELWPNLALAIEEYGDRARYREMATPQWRDYLNTFDFYDGHDLPAEGWAELFLTLKQSNVRPGEE